jgi:hypothetical protein
MELPRLRDEMPDVASTMEKRLRAQGRDDLAKTVPELRIDGGLKSLSRYGGELFFIEPDSIERPAKAPRWLADNRSKWHWRFHPNQRYYRLGKVPRKRLVITIVEIDGQIAVCLLWGSAARA